MEHVDEFNVAKTRGFRYFPAVLSPTQVTALLANLTRSDNFEDLHDLTKSKKTKRICGLEIELPDNVNICIKNFLKDFQKQDQTTTRVSVQYLIALADAPGQAYHLDTWFQYLTLVIYLTPSISTIFLDTDYSDVSDNAQGYPTSWPPNETARYTSVKPGDITVFWSNTPHAAPPNLRSDTRKVLYVAYMVQPQRPSEFDQILARQHLESPVFIKQYNAGMFLLF